MLKRPKRTATEGAGLKEDRRGRQLHQVSLSYVPEKEAIDTAETEELLKRSPASQSKFVFLLRLIPEGKRFIEAL